MINERINKAEEFVKSELMKLSTYEGKNLRMAEYRIEHSCGG